MLRASKKTKKKPSMHRKYAVRYTEKGGVNLVFGWHVVFFSVFSLIWGKNFLMGLRKKHPDPTKQPSKVFSLLFSLLFFYPL